MRMNLFLWILQEGKKNQHIDGIFFNHAYMLVCNTLWLHLISFEFKFPCTFDLLNFYSSQLICLNFNLKEEDEEEEEDRLLIISSLLICFTNLSVKNKVINNKKKNSSFGLNL